MCSGVVGGCAVRHFRCVSAQSPMRKNVRTDEDDEAIRDLGVDQILSTCSQHVVAFLERHSLRLRQIPTGFVLMPPDRQSTLRSLNQKRHSENLQVCFR